MKIVQKAAAGTLESSDIYIQVSPAPGASSIRVESVVLAQYGDAIREAIREVAEDCGLEDYAISAQDRGALDCTVRARAEAAIRRGMGGGAS